MTPEQPSTAAETTPTGTEEVAPASPLATDSLVEEVSIDGMCGVY